MTSPQIVRDSKYRHVFGTALKQQFCYQELRAQTNAWESADFVKANGQFFAIPWQGGGGSLAVIRLNDPGKKKPDLPLLTGHSAQILDFDFNPFNDNVIATASMDGTTKIWGIPQGGLTENIKDALVTLDGDDKKVGICKFHPVASNVLTTAGTDNVNNPVRLWDIETGKDKCTVPLPALPQSVSYNKNGSLFVTTTKDKKLRISDPRQGKIVQETNGHQGTKGARAVWLTSLDKIFSVGFTKLAERHFMILDPRKFDAPLCNTQIDVSSGIIMPFFDEDNNIIYLAGKGDGNIRFYELVPDAPYAHFISAYKSTSPQRGMGMVPKYALDVMNCEVARLLKLESTQIVPIMMQVPRKATNFQSDIFPDTRGFEAALTAEQYFLGQDADPKYIPVKPSENPYLKDKGNLIQTFTPKVQPKAPKTELPAKTNDPRELLKQNEELRKRVEDLEKENFNLKEKVKDLEDERSKLREAIAKKDEQPAEQTETTEEQPAE